MHKIAFEFLRRLHKLEISSIVGALQLTMAVCAADFNDISSRSFCIWILHFKLNSWKTNWNCQAQCFTSSNSILKVFHAIRIENYLKQFEIIWIAKSNKQAEVVRWKIHLNRTSKRIQTTVWWNRKSSPATERLRLNYACRRKRQNGGVSIAFPRGIVRSFILQVFALTRTLMSTLNWN